MILLLGDIKGLVKRGDCEPVANLIIAARVEIASKWKSTEQESFWD